LSVRLKLINPSNRSFYMQYARKFILFICLIVFPLFILARGALAQVNEVPAIAEQTSEGASAADGDISIMSLFKAGGWAMYPLLFLSVSGVGLVIYNFLMVREKAFLRPDIVEQLKPNMLELKLEEAKTLCDENPSVLTNIIYAGLERVDGAHVDPAAVKEAIEESSTEELAAPFVMINYLSIIATLSPMIGLLGTVSGMVKAFRAIAAQGMGQPQVLADNISEALVTTASGLIVAIPAMFFFAFFKNRYGKIASRVAKASGDIYYELIKGLRRHAG